MEILKEPTSLPFFWELYELKYVRCLEQCLNKERAPTEVFSVSKIKISWKNFLVISYLQHVCIRRRNFFSAVCSYHHNTTKKGKFVQICINKRKKKSSGQHFFCLPQVPRRKKQHGGYWSPPSRVDEAVPDRKQREGDSSQKHGWVADLGGARVPQTWKRTKFGRSGVSWEKSPASWKHPQELAGPQMVVLTQGGRDASPPPAGLMSKCRCGESGGDTHIDAW